MQRDHPQASLRLQCRLLGVCRSGLYYQPRQVDPEQLALMRRIDELSLAHPFYGSRPDEPAFAPGRLSGRAATRCAG